MILVCHVVSQDHVIKRSRDFMCRSTSRQVLTLGAFNYYARTQGGGGRERGVCEWVHQDANVCEPGGGRANVNANVRCLVHKLLTIITRFFVSFIKIPALLKT